MAGKESTYKSEHRLEDSACIERFLTTENANGVSERSLPNHRRAIRVCLSTASELGIDLDGFGPGEMRVLSDGLGGMDGRMRRRYLALFGRYVHFATGRIVVPGLPDAKLEKPLGEWLDNLRDCGANGSRLADSRKFVRHCFKLLWDDYGDLDPAEADDGALTALEGRMADLADETRRSYLSVFGRFIGWCTGRDPYRERNRPLMENDFEGYLEKKLDGCPHAEEVRRFVDHMVFLGYRKMTVRNSVNGVRRILGVLQTIEPGCGLESVDLDTYVRIRMAMRDLKASTTRVYMRAFAEFVKYTTGRDEYCERQLMLNDEDTRRVFLDRPDWERLVEAATPEQMVILALGAGMGLRRMEMANLRLDDFQDGKLKIRGKGHGPEGKVVLMDVPDAVRRAVEDYMPVRAEIVRRTGDRSEGRLLLKSVVHQGEPMSADNVGDSVYRLSKRTGVEFSTHSLRRLYATTLYEFGTDNDTLRRLMRHASVDTTLNCYIRPNEQRKKDAQKMLETELFGAVGRPSATEPRR